MLDGLFKLNREISLHIYLKTAILSRRSQEDELNSQACVAENLQCSSLNV